MSFNVKNFTPIGGQTRRGKAPGQWSYKSLTDDLATVLAPGYFDEVGTRILSGDFIIADLSDGKSILTVASTTLRPPGAVIDQDVISPGGESGDFVGPASSATDNLVSFADETGKLGKDSGTSAADIFASEAAAAQSASDALDSADDASNSETAAGISETNAGDSETAALAAASAAENSEFNASIAESNAAASAAQLIGTSSSSVAIGLGTKVFTTQVGKFFDAGSSLNIVSDANPTVNSMFGVVTSYSSSTLTMNIDRIKGSGNLSDWTIRVAGIEGIPGTAPVFRGALVYKSIDQPILDTTSTFLTWDLENYDDANIHDNIVNNSRLTVPAGVSRIILRGNLQWESNLVNDVITSFRKNGALFIGAPSLNTEGDTIPISENLVSAVLTVIPGDYFNFQVTQFSGVTLDVLEDSGRRTWFSMEIIE